MVKKIHIAEKINSILEISRIDQYVKSLLVFAPLLIIDSKSLIQSIFDIIPVFFGFVCLSSIIYIFNDIIDLKKDKLNPFKFNRPLVKKTVSIKTCRLLILFFISLFTFFFFYFSLFKLTFLFGLYFFINLFYCLILKKIFFLDILSVSSGYGLRVISGYIKIDNEVSISLITGVVLLSLLILLIKRRAEFNKKTYNNSLKFYSNKNIYKYITNSINLLIILNYYYFASNIFEFKLFVLSYILIFLTLFRLNFLILKDRVKTNITNFIIRDIYLIVFLFTWILMFILKDI